MPVKPNTNNKPNLTSTQRGVANSSILNRLAGMKWPPVTGADYGKMKAAIEQYKVQIKLTKEQAAKNAPGGTAAKPSQLLAAQENKIGTSLPMLGSYLPAGTDLSKTTFADAIKIMEDTVSQLDSLLRSPAQGLTSSGTAPSAR